MWLVTPSGPITQDRWSQQIAGGHSPRQSRQRASLAQRVPVTRGALNHHYPDFTDLLADALEAAYGRLLPDDEGRARSHSLEAWIRSAHRRLSQPVFMAVIELWLASQNSPEIGAAMTRHVRSLAWLFAPDMVLGNQPTEIDPALRAVLYRTVAEALIGLALGRASQGGTAAAHEPQVIDFLAQLAAAADRGELASVLNPGGGELASVLNPGDSL